MFESKDNEIIKLDLISENNKIFATCSLNPQYISDGVSSSTDLKL